MFLKIGMHVESYALSSDRRDKGRIYAGENGKI